jgi:hypothetical protein
MFAGERAVQPGLLGHEPLKRRSGHPAEFRVPRAALLGETDGERFGADAALRPSSIPCKCAVAFSQDARRHDGNQSSGLLLIVEFDDDEPIVDGRQCRGE